MGFRFQGLSLCQGELYRKTVLVVLRFLGRNLKDRVIEVSALHISLILMGVLKFLDIVLPL